MLLIQDKLVEKLMEENSEFRWLVKQHSALDKKIEEYNKQRYISTDEELEKKNLQKKKLILKERLTDMLKHYSG